MISNKTKIIISTILIIISISLITLFELINYYVIKIDFKFFDFEKYNKINKESMIYILEMSLIFMMFTSFALITVPIYLFKHNAVIISLVMTIFITFIIVFPEIGSIFKNINGFWSFIVVYY